MSIGDTEKILARKKSTPRTSRIIPPIRKRSSESDMESTEPAFINHRDEINVVLQRNALAKDQKIPFLYAWLI
ncbi:MAG: hypothetical protein A2020_05700 [Lentisphaerae bacterium GWF2_45_14]|nr:MAG: hypothetical protein A2020_05700 [Lentisphaerae bacterium GWF2_45_14]